MKTLKILSFVIIAVLSSSLITSCNQEEVEPDAPNHTSSTSDDEDSDDALTFPTIEGPEAEETTTTASNEEACKPYYKDGILVDCESL